MFYCLPPAGNPVHAVTTAGDTEWFYKTFSPLRPHLFGSGAQALAASIMAIRRTQAATAQPEVILPAYACPELVSAVLFAGVTPRLIDLAPQRPWLDLTAVAKTIGPATLAIIGVNLFGIRERWHELQQIAQQYHIPLIEDSAQLFPARDDLQRWYGDIVILSFGRGKPVSVLSGGAALATTPVLHEALQAIAASTPKAETSQTKTELKRIAYNLLRLPQFYWLPSAIPWLHLGETQFHPLLALQGMTATAQQLLPDNIQQYWSRTDHVERELRERLTAADLPGVTDLATACGVTHARLNRYPLYFTNPAKRDRVLQRLSDAGLGASRLYPAPLPQLPGLEAILANTGAFPNAAQFAQSILTLPTHELVRTHDIDKILEILTKSLLSGD